MFWAQKPQDHMLVERLEAFIPDEKRCNCNGKNCIFPSCRQEYKDMIEVEEAARTLHMG